MILATARRTCLALPPAVLMFAAGLIAPGNAVATPPNSCTGHLVQGVAGADTQLGDHPVAFTLGCAFQINGFSLVSSNELQGFDTDLTVYDPGQALIPNEMFSCEGDQPGFGVDCNGAYGGGYHVIKGSFLTTDDPCAQPREDMRVVVSYASVGKAGVVTNSMAGPFNLGRVHGCPKVLPATTKTTTKKTTTDKKTTNKKTTTKKKKTTNKKPTTTKNPAKKAAA